MFGIELTNSFPYWLLSPRDCGWLPDTGQAVPAGWPRYALRTLAFGLHRDTCLLISQAVQMARDATNCGIFSEWFRKAAFGNGPWVPSRLPFCCWYPGSVVLLLLTITAGCPTECFLVLLASSDSLHLPLLPLCTHLHMLPLLALPMPECLVRWCLEVFRSQLLYTFSSLLCHKASCCLEKQLWM